MEIRDVIGQLRADYLELVNRIHELKLVMHLIEYRLSKLEMPCAPTQSAPSTKETDSGHTQLTIEQAFDTPTPEASVGEMGKRPQYRQRRNRGSSAT